MNAEQNAKHDLVESVSTGRDPTGHIPTDECLAERSMDMRPDHEPDIDDLVFRACMVSSGAGASFAGAGALFEFTGASSEHLLLLPTMELYTPYVPPRRVDAAGNPVPRYQPGAGIYTSPLTKNVSIPLPDLIRLIGLLLTALRLPYLYNAVEFNFCVQAYFSSAYAIFNVRIWSRNDGFAVEVMRERGDRIMVIRVFECLTALLSEPSDEAARDKIAAYGASFDVAMFDWAPRPLPDDVLAMLPQPTREEIASGISSMFEMITDPCDDVARNGCASVAKLAAASTRTRDNFAASPEIVSALIDVAVPTRPLSMSTRTLAAVALSEISSGLDQIGIQQIRNLSHRIESVESLESEHFKIYLAKILADVSKNVTKM